MSCIRFNTPAQRRQMASAAPRMLDDAEAAALAAPRGPVPELTASKLQRIAQLARDENPKIREAAAAHRNAPLEVRAALARDEVASVRAWVARNETTPCDLLRELAHDDDPTVRAWVAVNYAVPEDAMAVLAEDDDETVRSLVAWKASLRLESA